MTDIATLTEALLRMRRQESGADSEAKEQRIRELEAENARLVERVAELEDLERRMDWKGEDA